MININIICTNDELPIYHHTNPTLFAENVFAYDDNDKMISNFTYDTDIYMQPNIWKTVLERVTKNNKNTIDKGFLFYSSWHQSTYCHFLLQTLNKLYDYLHNFNDYTLIVPSQYYNKFVIDIFKLFNIDNSKICVMDMYTCYNIKDLQGGGTKNTACEVTESAYWVFRELRKSVNILQNVNPHRKIYLKRDNKPNTEYGNGEFGKNRQILNESELINKLEALNFEIITVGDKLIEEKYNLLKDADIIVTPIGANCMNLVFTNAPKKIIYVSNQSPLNISLYNDLFNILNNTSIESILLTHPDDYSSVDPMNNMNNPFYVDIPRLLGHL